MQYEVSSDIFQRLERIKGSLLLSLKEDLYKLAVEYSYIRGQWKFLSVEERMELENSRRASHNAFIDACNILSRSMVKEGYDVSWRTSLGDDRKSLGDFACQLACVIALQAR